MKTLRLASNLILYWTRFITGVFMNIPITIILLPLYLTKKTFLWLLPISILLDIICCMMSYLLAYKNVLNKMRESSLFKNQCSNINRDNLTDLLEFYKKVCKEQRLVYCVPTFVGIKSNGVLGGFTAFPFVDGSVLCLSKDADMTDRLTETLIAHELLHCFTHSGFRAQAKMQRIIVFVSCLLAFFYSLCFSSWWLLTIVLLLSMLLWYYAEEEVESKTEMDADALSLRWICHKYGKTEMVEMASVILSIRIHEFLKCPKKDKKHLMLFNTIKMLMPCTTLEERSCILKDIENECELLYRNDRKHLQYKMLLLRRAFHIETVSSDVYNPIVLGISPVAIILLPILFVLTMICAYQLLSTAIIQPWILWFLILEAVIIIAVILIKRKLWKIKQLFLSQRIVQTN